MKLICQWTIRYKIEYLEDHRSLKVYVLILEVL